ncbi:MAG: flavodoxin family protein [Planctomycetota bacterium]|jgi:multimeric flavodoxin WrbA|nr:flavodoxin family protein [Planctomycetota bacterium]
MATVLAVLCSGRKKGYTAGLLNAAVEGIGGVEGVNAEVVHLWDYQFQPCRSCFHCIRNPEHDCAQSDAMGRDGELHQKVAGANGMFIADAVHFWGPSAMCHLFIERLYPFLWGDGLNGMPFASVSCASNQGMQILATKDICKWASSLKTRYVGGLPVHLCYYEKAIEEARDLGARLGEAALRDEREGRQTYADDEERFLAYDDSHWHALRPYLQNLTNDTFEADSSLIAEALHEGAFTRPEANELLEKALPKLEATLSHYQAGDRAAAYRELVATSALWTNATWLEFLEQDVVRGKQPESYRPLPSDE